MSHVSYYGIQVPWCKGIIHLSATSCYVGDNTDIIVMREGLRVIRRKLINVIALLAGFADSIRDMPAACAFAAGAANDCRQTRWRRFGSMN